MPSALKIRLNALKQFNFMLFWSIFIFTFFSGLATFAQGNLLISPRRIVFEGNKRTQEINLANTGKDTAKYLISIIEIRMKDDGGFEEIATPDPGQYFANKFLRFFPRSVTLAPNESQVVKVQLIKTNELVEAEYRSHIYFRAIPNLKPLGEKEAKKDTTNISVQLTPVFGISIPVIIRNGKSDTHVKISGLSYKMNSENKPNIEMSIDREGNTSVYGDIIVNFIDKSGKSTEVGSAKGVAVYTPNKFRKFQFDLSNEAHVNMSKGKLQVIFSPQSEEKPNAKIEPFAQSEVVVQ